MPCNVSVTTTHPDGKRDIKVIDHDDHDHRVWLGKHAYWAMRSGREVTTAPTSAPVTYVKKEA